MVTLKCKTCGSPFNVTPSRATKAQYCSVPCKNTALTGVYTARVNLICAYCKEPFSREAGRLRHGRGKHCSTDCQYAAIKARPSTATEQRFCLNCNEPFEFYYRQQDIEARGLGKYCSRTCRDEHRQGSNHPQYLGPRLGYDHGPNWQAQRRKARKRDNQTCQHCGKPGNDVHHIRPFRIFGAARYKEANDLTNLVTLCHPCHRLADAALQHVERKLMKDRPLISGHASAPVQEVNPS